MVGSEILMSEEAQLALEKRLADLERRLAAQEITTEDAAGTIEDWMVVIGPQWFLLHPAHRLWFRWDRLHESWEPTPYEVGRWTLAVVDGRAGAIERPV